MNDKYSKCCSSCSWWRQPSGYNEPFCTNPDSTIKHTYLDIIVDLFESGKFREIAEEDNIEYDNKFSEFEDNIYLYFANKTRDIYFRPKDSDEFCCNMWR